MSSQINGSAGKRPLALVTGASSGIGEELAKQFPVNGFDLIIAAADVGIHAVAARLDSPKTSVETVQVDLAKPQGVDSLYDRIRVLGRPVDAAALNAGIGASGAFVGETRLQDELQIIDLNVRSTVHLAKLLLSDMVGRGEGRAVR
jgi:short-subunit dehydrogenase